MSTDIRWSLDLRWQKPSDPIGFYNLKEGVLMRSSKDSDLDINWESFNNVDRHEEQKKATVKIVSNLQDNSYYLDLIELHCTVWQLILARCLFSLILAVKLKPPNSIPPKLCSKLTTAGTLR